MTIDEGRDKDWPVALPSGSAPFFVTTVQPSVSRPIIPSLEQWTHEQNPKVLKGARFDLLCDIIWWWGYWVWAFEWLVEQENRQEEHVTETWDNSRDELGVQSRLMFFFFCLFVCFFTVILILCSDLWWCWVFGLLFAVYKLVTGSVKYLQLSYNLTIISWYSIVNTS